MNGILVLDKPEGLTSAHAVEKVKRALGAARAGHGGTLDPMATGVLAICLGEATKLAPYLLADDKAYEAEGLLGVETDTLDRTGQVTGTRAVAVAREDLEAALASFRGAIAQVPPMYSALKQDGRRLYKLARAGETVERAPRAVRIDRLELVRWEPPRFELAIACSKGTYVRSLVADIGTAVGAGAHLTALRRTQSGKFGIAQAVTLEHVQRDPAGLALIALAAATDLPSVRAAAELHGQVRNGVQLPVSTFGAENLERFQILDEEGRLLAICHPEGEKTVYERVFVAP